MKVSVYRESGLVVFLYPKKIKRFTQSKRFISSLMHTYGTLGNEKFINFEYK
jgi:hypothetical protein